MDRLTTQFRTLHLLAGAIALAALLLVVAPGAAAGDRLQPVGTTDFIQVEDRDFATAMEGLSVAPVAGDFTAGPHGTLVRLAPGTRIPLHHYDAPLTGVVIEGSVAHPVPGNPVSKHPLGPGDTFSFAANEPHETNNLSGTEWALFFIFQDAAWVFELD